MTGIGMVVLALICDAIYGPYQDKIVNGAKARQAKDKKAPDPPSAYHLMFNMNFYQVRFARRNFDESSPFHRSPYAALLLAPCSCPSSHLTALPAPQGLVALAMLGGNIAIAIANGEAPDSAVATSELALTWQFVEKHPEIMEM